MPSRGRPRRQVLVQSAENNETPAQDAVPQADEPNQVENQELDEIPEEVGSIIKGLEDHEQTFYTSLYQGLVRTKLSFDSNELIDFDAERIFNICKVVGFNVVNSAQAFADTTTVDNLPEQNSGIAVDEFLFSNKESVDTLKSYVTAVAQEKCSTSHFVECQGQQLNANVLTFYQRLGNPYPKPFRLDGPFGQFEVSHVCTHAAHMGKFNTQILQEYTWQYIVASHLFDAATALLKVVHLPFLPAYVTKYLCLCSQNILTQVDMLDTKLQENILLASPDSYVRKFSRAMLRGQKPVPGLKPKLAEIQKLAAEARVKTLKQSVQNTASSSTVPRTKRSLVWTRDGYNQNNQQNKKRVTFQDDQRVNMQGNHKGGGQQQQNTQATKSNFKN